MVGRGGCASTTPVSCGEPLQYRPARQADPKTQPNSPLAPGLVAGTGCQASAVPGANTCSFTTANPDGSSGRGAVSAASGRFEVRASTSGCRIWADGRAYTGSFGLVHREGDRDVFKAGGFGVGTLGFDDHCTYTLTVDPGGKGAVYAGQVDAPG